MSPINNKYSAIIRFLLHLHPRRVNEQALNYSRTFGLGGINALLFVILALSGILLRFSYVPTPHGAYDSILALQHQSVLGSLLRNVHHWSATLMVVTAFLHMLRVFYSTSIFEERKKNWYYGLLLFVLVLAFNFTGYLLPWDQLSFWAVTIMTNILEYLPFIGEFLANLIRGGEVVDGKTLLNFYSFHTALLPLLFVLFMVLHFWLIRKAKGVTVARRDEVKMVEVNPELISKELVVGLVLIVALLLFSMFFNAPLLEKANPMVSPNPSKAPWYFMGIQELLINLHPVMATFIIPLSIGLFFYFIPKMTIEKENIGVWYYSVKGKKIILWSAVFSAVLTLLIIMILAHALQLSELNMPLFISTGLIPLLMYLIPVAIFIYYIKKTMSADKFEIIIAITTMIFVSYIMMSVVGVWFRGEGMLLVF